MAQRSLSSPNAEQKGARRARPAGVDLYPEQQPTAYQITTERCRSLYSNFHLRLMKCSLRGQASSPGSLASTLALLPPLALFSRRDFTTFQHSIQELLPYASTRHSVPPCPTPLANSTKPPSPPTHHALPLLPSHFRRRSPRLRARFRCSSVYQSFVQERKAGCFPTGASLHEGGPSEGGLRAGGAWEGEDRADL